MPKSGISDAIRAHLSDGEWHDQEQIAAACRHTISPVTASRSWERDCGPSRGRKAPPPPPGDIIAYGQRAGVLQMLRRLSYRQQVERMQEGKRTLWRLLP